jgi:hypothetical protein
MRTGSEKEGQPDLLLERAHLSRGACLEGSDCVCAIVEAAYAIRMSLRGDSELY